MSYGAVKLSPYLCYVIFWSNSRQDEYHNMPETFTVKVTHLDIYCSLSLYCTLFYFILFFIWPGKFFLQHFSGWLIFVWRSLNSSIYSYSLLYWKIISLYCTVVDKQWHQGHSRTAKKEKRITARCYCFV